MSKPYPYLKVIVGFALLGSLMGGTSAMVCLAPGLRPSLDSWVQTKDFLNLFLQNALVFAIPPSLLTGLWLAWRRVPRTQQGLMQAAIAGLVFSVLTALVAILFFLHSPPENLVFLLLAMMLAGVVSATFLASWLLPKSATAETHE